MIYIPGDIAIDVCNGPKYDLPVLLEILCKSSAYFLEFGIATRPNFNNNKMLLRI